jgi:hypothetical protein
LPAAGAAVGRENVALYEEVSKRELKPAFWAIKREKIEKFA